MNSLTHNNEITKILKLCDDIDVLPLENLQNLAKSVGLLNTNNVDDKELLCATVLYRKTRNYSNLERTF